MFLFSPSLSLFQATSRSERPARSTMHQPRKSSFFEGLFFAAPNGLLFFRFRNLFRRPTNPAPASWAKSGLSSHLKHSDGGVQDLRGKKTRGCEELHWRNTAYIPIYCPKTHSSFIFEAKSKACSKAIIMRAPLLCETCCNDQDQGYVTSYNELPLIWPCQTLFHLYALFGQPCVLSFRCPNNFYPSFHLGAVGPCGWAWRGSSCPRAWRVWRAWTAARAWQC